MFQPQLNKTHCTPQATPCSFISYSVLLCMAKRNLLTTEEQDFHQTLLRQYGQNQMVRGWLKVQVCMKKLEGVKSEGLRAQLFLPAAAAGLIKDELFLPSETVSLPRKIVPPGLLSQIEILPCSIPVN